MTERRLPAAGAMGTVAATPTTDERVMAMLHEHVPLALLVDLTRPDGPDSRRILAEEGAPDEQWWIQP